VTAAGAPLDALVEALSRVQAALAAGDAVAAATAMDAAVAATRQAQALALNPAQIAPRAALLLEACEASARALSEQLLGSMEELGVSARAHLAYRR
jgi:hypothetical protein